MRVSLFPTEFKILVRCVGALAKLGQEIYFDWENESFVLKTVNAARSAFASVSFKRLFFEKFHGPTSSKTFRFKVPNRCCLSVFKLSASMERTLQKCRMMIPPDENLLVVQFFCKHGIVKTFNMSIADSQFLEAVYSLEGSANHLVLPTKIFTEILGNFRPSTEELTLILKENDCTLQNHIPYGESSAILTQIPLVSTEFDSYVIGCRSELTFCQKELRSLLTFCELISPVLRVHCDCPGRPIVFDSTHENRLTARFVLATLPIDASLSSESQHSQTYRSRVSVPQSSVLPRSDSSFANISINSSSILPGPSSAVRQISDDAPVDHSRLLAPTLLAPSNSSPVPPVCRPTNPPVVRNPVTSNTTSNALDDWDLPPIKKTRSVLFSHLEDSQEDDTQTSDAMDQELLDMTKRYDGCVDLRPCGLTSQDHSTTTTTTPHRTVLVADSDEENN